MVKIGIANAEAAKHAGSSYEAVDLLDVESGGVESRTPYSINSDSDSDGESTNSSDSESSGDESGLSEDSSSTTGESESKSGTSDTSEGGSFEDDIANSTAATEKHRNFMAPVRKRSDRPQLSNSNSSRSNGGPKSPPLTSFKHKRRFQNVGMGAKKDRKGRHQRLPSDGNEALRLEEKRGGQKHRGNRADRRPLVVNNGSGVRVPADAKAQNKNSNGRVGSTQSSQQPQMDAEYGVTDDYSYASYSYTSADPNSIDYDPRSLRKMGTVDNREHNEKMQKRIICWGLTTAMIICVMIMIGSIVAYETRIDVQSAPEKLDEICSLKSIGTSKGHKHCEKACKKADCCMASGEQSCFLQQKDECTEYSPCGNIYTNYNEDLLVPPAPSNIETICSDANIMTQTGFYECQATCNPGLCCLPSAVNEVSGLDGTPPEVKECRSTHEDICQYYTPCESLAGLNHNHGSPVDLVNLKCSPHNLMFAEGKEDCENVCETRVCCFAGSKYNNCRDDNEVWCDDFSACDLLLEAPNEDTNESGPESNSGTDSVIMCSDPQNLNYGDLASCKEVCQDTACCFYEDWNCENHIDCPFYQFCQEIVEAFPSLGNQGPSNDHGVGEVGLDTDDIMINVDPGTSSTPKQVATACADLSTSSGKDKCYYRCDDYRCCFKDNYDPISCHNLNICEKYKPCKKLENLQSNDPDQYPGWRPEQVEAACIELSTSSGKDKCFDLCDDYRCCFKDNYDPITCHNQDICDQFMPCKKLENLQSNDPDQYPGSTPEQVEAACTDLSTSSGKDECFYRCNDYRCCFKDNYDPITCHNQDICDQFMPCKKLENLQYPAPTVNLKGVCFATDDSFYVEQCKAVCKVAECCSTGHCTHIDSFCEQYAACDGVGWGDQP